MEKRILIQERVDIWREFYLTVPEGMTEEEFVKKLKETDPAANNYENNGIEYIDGADTTIEVEYRTEDYILIDSHKIEQDKE